MYVTPSPQLSNALQVDPSRVMAGKRIYQVWKGSNRFFLGGRLIFGPDVRSLAVTIILIVVPMAIFCIYVAKHLMDEFSHHAGVAIMVVAVIYTFGVLVLLLLTSARDPGIIPRNAYPPEPEDDYDIGNSPSDWGGGQTPRLRLPRTKDVIVNGVSVKTKFCDTCLLYRPPRCSHCSICNNCVERFDHHCPWVGQCIGQRNYPFFFMFVSTTTLLCMYVFAMSALRIKKLMEGNTPHSVWKALRNSPASIFLMVYTFIAIWFVGGLTIFHLYLISTNQTTYENFRYRYDNKVNPYNRGILQNFKEILCSGIPPSKNKFREKVQEELSGYLPNPQARVGDILSPNHRKVSGDIEMGGKPGWASMVGGEGFQELHERKSNSSDVGMELKEGYEDTFAQALGHSFTLEGGDIRSGSHPRRSSWGRKSGSWDMTPEIIALSTGIGGEGSRVNGDNTPPGNR